MSTTTLADVLFSAFAACAGKDGRLTADGEANWERL